MTVPKSYLTCTPDLSPVQSLRRVHRGLCLCDLLSVPLTRYDPPSQSSRRYWYRQSLGKLCRYVSLCTSPVDSWPQGVLLRPYRSGYQEVLQYPVYRERCRRKSRRKIEKNTPLKCPSNVVSRRTVSQSAEGRTPFRQKRGTPLSPSFGV